MLTSSLKFVYCSLELRDFLPISSSTRQHLVDTNDMEWMKSHPNVELIFATEFNKIFVSANAACFQSFRAQLLIFIRHEMNTKRKFFHECLLSAQVIDTNLRVWNTTTEARFWVRLVLTITVATKRDSDVREYNDGVIK